MNEYCSVFVLCRFPVVSVAPALHACITHNVIVCYNTTTSNSNFAFNTFVGKEYGYSSLLECTQKSILMSVFMLVFCKSLVYCVHPGPLFCIHFKHKIDNKNHNSLFFTKKHMDFDHLDMCGEWRMGWTMLF
jgi:hypothetical protein